MASRNEKAYNTKPENLSLLKFTESIEVGVNFNTILEQYRRIHELSEEELYQYVEKKLKKLVERLRWRWKVYSKRLEKMIAFFVGINYQSSTFIDLLNRYYAPLIQSRKNHNSNINTFWRTELATYFGNYNLYNPDSLKILLDYELNTLMDLNILNGYMTRMHSDDEDAFNQIVTISLETLTDSKPFIKLLNILIRNEWFNSESGHVVVKSLESKVTLELQLVCIKYLKHINFTSAQFLKLTGEMFLNTEHLMLLEELFAYNKAIFARNNDERIIRKCLDLIQGQRISEQFRYELDQFLKSAKITELKILDVILPFASRKNQRNWNDDIEKLFYFLLEQVDFNKQENLSVLAEFVIREGMISDLIKPCFRTLKPDDPSTVHYLVQLLHRRMGVIFDPAIDYFLKSQVDFETRNALVKKYIYERKVDMLLPILRYCLYSNFYDKELLNQFNSLLDRRDLRVKIAVIEYLTASNLDQGSSLRKIIRFAYSKNDELRETAENYMSNLDYQSIAETDLRLLQRIVNRLLKLSNLENLSKGHQSYINKVNRTKYGLKKPAINPSNIPTIKNMIDNFERQKNINDSYFREFTSDDSIM